MARSVHGASIVVKGSQPGPAFPRSSDELRHALVLDGRKRPFEIRAGAFGADIRAMGEGTVHGPALSNGDIRLEVVSGQMQRWFGGLRAAGEILVRSSDDQDRTPQSGAAATVGGVRFVVRGDIAAGARIVLENVLVAGSVSAPEIQLKNSVILGDVVTVGEVGELHAVCSTFGLYDVGSLILEGPTTLHVAGGVSDHEPVFRDHVDTTGGDTVHPFAMRALALCRDPQIGCGIPTELSPEVTGTIAAKSPPGTCCAHWVEGACPFADAVSLGRHDFVQLAPHSGQDPDAPSEAPEDRGRWFFGLQNRSLDWAPVDTAGKRFASLLHGVMAFHHLADDARARLLAGLRDGRISPNESRLLLLAIDGLEPEAGLDPGEH